MKNIGFLVDSSGNLELLKAKNVHILPVKVIITNPDGSFKEYDDYTGFTRSDVINAINNDLDIKTSQTPFGLIEENLINLLKKYDRVYCLTISKTLSGLYSSYCQIKKKLDEIIDDDRIVVVDTNALSIDQNFLIEEITKWEEQGISLNQIMDNIKTFTSKRCGGVIIKNLKMLIKGGRLTGVKAVLAKMLHLNLFIEWYLGVLTYKDKSTRINDAIDKNIENIQKNINFKQKGIKRLVFYNGWDDKNEANELIQYTLSKLNLPHDYKYINIELPGVIIIHLGTNYFGFYIETN